MCSSAPTTFQNEPWYGEFQIYRNLGVCQPKPEHVLEVQKALKVMGYPTHAAERNGKTDLLPGEKQPESTKTLKEEWKHGAAGGTERSCLSAGLEIFPAKRAGSVKKRRDMFLNMSKEKLMRLAGRAPKAYRILSMEPGAGCAG